MRHTFERVQIQHCEYQVAGPNALWHHDGQHGVSILCLLIDVDIETISKGLIRWRVVIHGFIDGYSHLIVGLRASNNNRGSTVLKLFLDAAQVYGVPSRLRGDHGTENIEVATWMEENRGICRGSYIWGR